MMDGSMRKYRACVLAIALTLLVLALPGAASATVGDFAFHDCLASTGNPGCTLATTASFGDSTSVAASTDGKSLYTVNPGGSILNIFSRDASTGALTQQGCISNAAVTGCTTATFATMTSITRVAISPDDTSVYVSSIANDAITSFTRNPATGALNYQGCISNAAISGCTTATHATFSSPSDIVVSSDGKFVYVTNGGGVTTLARASDGSLSYQGCLLSGGAIAGCTTALYATFGSATQMAVSPNGDSLYVSGWANGSGSVTSFTRDGTTGSLMQQGCISQVVASGCTQAAHGSIEAAGALAVSPDNNSVYVVSPSVSGMGIVSNTITSFTRAANGTLTYQGCTSHAAFTGCVTSAKASIDGPGDIVVSPDGQSAYVTSYYSNSLTGLSRAGDGTLTAQSCVSIASIAGCTNYPGGLVGAVKTLAISSDGKSIYTATGAGVVANFTREAPVVVVPPAVIPPDVIPDLPAPIASPGPPPNTLKLKGPKAKIKVTSAAFQFKSDVVGTTFQCKLDKKPYTACKSGIKLKKLKKGKHTFSVRAVNSDGTDASPLVYRFKVA